MTTTLTPRELPASDARACPTWCTLDSNHGDLGTYEESGLPFRCHQGPTFGQFSAGTEQTIDGMNPPSVILGDLDGKELDAEQMAEFARNATLAAEWLRQHS